MHDNRIVPWAPYGAHIDIRCSQCGRIGHTKNIGTIGARTLFDVCSCPAPLEPVRPADAAQRSHELRREAALTEFIDQYVDERTPDLRELNNHRRALSESLQWVKEQRKSARHHYHRRVRQLLDLA